MNKETTEGRGAEAGQVKQPVRRPVPKRCEYCDDTGDVTGRDGEWRGYCVCDAGAALKAGTKSSA